MDNEQELAGLSRKVQALMLEELAKNGTRYDLAEAKVGPPKTVGVQGDERTYRYTAELTLYHEGKFVWQPEFLAQLSNRITNNIKEVNRVVYTIGKKD